MSAATASIAGARPQAPRPTPPTARPLVRPTAAPGLAVARPLLSASERPVCGNIANKGPAMRVCKDALGTTYKEARERGTWASVSRTCTRGPVTVTLDADGRAQVTTTAADGTSRTAAVVAGASLFPLVAACRRGLR